MQTLKKVIKALPPEFYKKYLQEAKKVVEDINDLPFAAAAIALGSPNECGVWSNDNHFLSKEKDFFNKWGIRVWSTTSLNEFMSK